MATDLQIDEKLIDTAVELGGHPSKKAAVTQALTDYIQHLKQQKVLGEFGTIEYVSDYNYKKHRTRP